MSETLDILKELIGDFEPVSFRTFVTSPDYCNNQEMYEFWLSEIESLPLTVSEILVDGSIGGGKSYAMNYLLAYRLYVLFLSGSPQQQLGLASDSDIFGFYFTVSMEMAKQSGFNHLYTIFKTCKWFRDNAPINENLKSVIEFTNQKFYIKAGSDFGHQLGLNVFCFILDEANFREGVGQGMAKEYEEVTMLYQQLIDRQYSRMSNADGTLNALAILISSASYQTSFIETRKQAIVDDPNAVNITAVGYKIRPERYSKETFEVFIGAGSVEPCIIENEDHKLNILRVSNLLGTGQEEQFFRQVPVNLLKQFKANIVLALQNHCGVATLLQGSFMTNMKYLYKSYNEDLPLLFQSEELVASTEDDTQLIEYFIPENVQYSERPHSLFLDLSVAGDSGALTCYRYDGIIDNKRMHTKVFELKIIPPSFPGQTRITKVKQLVIDLSEFINIVVFGSDNYQSINLRQDVQAELGLEDVRLSLDSTDIPFMCWVRALVDERISQRKSTLLEKEVTEAVHDYQKHRVLKAKGSSDDTLQSNVGAFFLSDTFGSQQGTLEDLYPDRINLIGGKSINKVLSQLGYQTF